MITILSLLPCRLRPRPNPPRHIPNILPLPLHKRSPLHSSHMRRIRFINRLPGSLGHVVRTLDLLPGPHGVGLDLFGLGAGLLGCFVGFAGVFIGLFGVLLGAFDFVV